MKEVEFVFCVEAGYLEKQSKLLVHSIRNYGGSFKDCNIVAYQPRKKYKVSKPTRDYYLQNRVEFIDLPLNKEFAFYKFGNKPIICAHREQHFPNRTLIYLDCDIFIYNEPVLFIEISKNQILARAEDSKGYGTKIDFSDEYGAIWKKAYEYFGIKNRSGVFTLRDYSYVQPYYNAGHFGIKNETQFCNRWLDNLRRLIRLKIVPKQCLILIEQMAFSITITQMQLEILEMGVKYNFPANLYAFDEIAHPKYQNVNCNSLCSVHYHQILGRGYNPMENWLSKTKHGTELNKQIEKLDLLNIKDVSLYLKVLRKMDDLITNFQFR